jgi:hypothetical protein
MFELSIPNFSKKGTSKDLILNVLATEWSLTLKEIYNRCKKNFRYSGSYQSIFKSINELLGKKVLIKKDREYEINISWIKNLQSWTDVVETNYYAEKKIKDFSNKKSSDISILNFSSIFDAEKYLYYFVKNELKKTKNKKIIYEMNNLWKVLFYMRAEHNYYTKLQKLGHEFYFLILGNSDIEKRAVSFYKNLGVNIKRRKEELTTDTILFDDYYIQFFIPENIKKKINEFLSNGRTMELLKILDEDANIKLIIHKDRELAEGISRKLLRNFKLH